MTKKSHQLFLGKKCTPRENPGYAIIHDLCSAIWNKLLPHL